jgi:hypothetical protein
MVSKFRKVERQKVKASIMIEGLQGTGKSGLALAIAKVLSKDWSKIYAIDTENQSLDLFDGIKLSTGEDVKDFNKVDLTVDDGFAPSNYMKLREAAIADGAEVVIMDSISHMWNRKGGLLDKVSEAQAQGLDSYRSWGTDENRKEKELIFDLVRSPKAHIITTVRDKEKFGMEFDETRGKNKVVSLGEQQVQQEGLKYEPDLVLRMVSAGAPDGTAPVAEVLKSRYTILRVGEEYEFTAELLEQLRQYLAEGVDPEVILKAQKEEVMKAIKDYCTTPARKSIWKSLKESAGFNGKLEDMPLETMKQLYRQLIAD